MKTYIVELLGFPTQAPLNTQVGQIEVKAYDSDEAVKNLGNRAYVLNDVLCDQWMVLTVTEKA